MLLHEETTLRLREMFDTQGKAEFETAAKNIMIVCATLIQHVSGPSKLQDLIDAIPMIVGDEGSLGEASKADPRLLN